MSSPPTDSVRWAFNSRWLLSFRLTTAAPLHIGDGRTFRDEQRLKQKGTNNAVEYDTVITGAGTKPIIPGASLKGVLRPVLERLNRTAAIRLLGSTSTEHKHSPHASAATFFDGRFVSSPVLKARLPHWDQTRGTAIATNVSIHRITRTADEGRLFHGEYVPAGTVFTVEVAAERVQDSDIPALIEALAAFNHPDTPLRLGAHTSAGWGEMKFDSLKVHRLDAEGLKAWFAGGSVESGWDIVTAHGTDLSGNYTTKAANPAATPAHRVPVTLRFTDFLLVHDPSNEDKLGREDKPHHALRDPDGSPALPARSVRGVLRARADMIARTLGLPVCTSTQPCAPVHKADEAGSRCLVCQLFGCTGWRSLVDVAINYEPPVAGAKLAFPDFVQDFIAIDRFMGGGAPGAKFSAVPAWQPVFIGDIAVADRLASLPHPDALRGLLALVLRDLRDGYLTFGWGAAKGYGSCNADVDVAALHALAAGLPALRALAAQSKPSASHVVS